MASRAELEQQLADARDRLEALPPAHRAEHIGAVVARRIALNARVRWLEQELSTAPVQEVPNPGDDMPPGVQ